MKLNITKLPSKQSRTDLLAELCVMDVSRVRSKYNTIASGGPYEYSEMQVKISYEYYNI